MPRTIRSYSKTCVVCDTLFTVYPCHAFVSTCSKKCGYEKKKLDAIQARAKRRPPCAFCGRPITRKQIHYDGRPHLFCDNKCYGQWRTKTINGAVHPNWRGGYEPYYGANWRSQRAKARARDKTCRRCGKTPKENGKAFDVHHLIPFREFGIARYKEANALSNLVSLCANCHAAVEWKSGRPHSL